MLTIFIFKKLLIFLPKNLRQKSAFNITIGKTYNIQSF